MEGARGGGGEGSSSNCAVHCQVGDLAGHCVSELVGWSAV